MGCAASRTAPSSYNTESKADGGGDYDYEDDAPPQSALESLKEVRNAALDLIHAKGSGEGAGVPNRGRTLSASDRAARKAMLQQMRKEQEHFTAESVEQFQFLISMPLEDRKKWSELFARVDTSGDGLVSQDEVFDEMEMEGSKISREFLASLFRYFNDQHVSRKNISSEDLNEHSFFIGIFNFCTLPRGDYMTRFVFQLYGGTEEGMSPKQVRATPILSSRGARNRAHVRASSGGRERKVLRAGGLPPTTPSFARFCRRRRRAATAAAPSSSSEPTRDG
jgi:Ca2+-binding EF-hand superfamily protein